MICLVVEIIRAIFHAVAVKVGMLVSGMTVVIMILPGGTISVTAFAVGSAGMGGYGKE